MNNEQQITVLKAKVYDLLEESELHQHHIQSLLNVKNELIKKIAELRLSGTDEVSQPQINGVMPFSHRAEKGATIADGGAE